MSTTALVPPRSIADMRIEQRDAGPRRSGTSSLADDVINARAVCVRSPWLDTVPVFRGQRWVRTGRRHLRHHLYPLDAVAYPATTERTRRTGNDSAAAAAVLDVDTRCEVRPPRLRQRTNFVCRAVGKYRLFDL